MRILVAGGAGFIGSHYVRTLISGGYPGFTDARVTVLDRLTTWCAIEVGVCWPGGLPDW